MTLYLIDVQPNPKSQCEFTHNCSEFAWSRIFRPRKLEEPRYRHLVTSMPTEVAANEGR